MAKRKVSPFKKGRAEKRESSGGSKFLNILPDESVILAPMVGLEEMISADMHQHWNCSPPVYHPCVGRSCPGCIVGNEARFKGFLPVMVKGETEPIIYSFTISVYNQLEELEDSLDDGESLAGMAIKIKRTGSGLKTRYLVIGTGKRIEFDIEPPDIVPFLGPVTVEEIWDLLDETDEYDRSEYEVEKPKPRRKPKKVEEPEEDLDEEEDDEDLDDWGDV